MKRLWHGFRRKEADNEEKPRRFSISPELAGLFMTLLLKVVGETVKDRVLRAILTALIAGLGAYFLPSNSSVSIDVPSPPVVQPNRAEEPRHIVTGEVLPDSHRTALDR
jgi:hypothetical protein